MSQKKTMKLWQMIIILVLSFMMLATMFLPAYKITSDTLKEGMEQAQEDENYYKNEKARDKDIKKYTKKFKKLLEREEKENGTDNSSISGIKLMTKSISDIVYNGKYDDEYAKEDMGTKNFDDLNKKHKMTKILLWMNYALVLIVILITILGYCLKWNKLIPLIVDAVYGLIAAITFAVLRFATISGVSKQVSNLTEQFIGKDFVNIDKTKFSTNFLSYAFLLGLAVAFVILVVSVVSLFVGNQNVDDIDSSSEPEDMDDWDRDWNQPHSHMPVSGSASSQESKIPGYTGDVQGVDPFEKSVIGVEPVSQVIAEPKSIQHAVPPTMPVQEAVKKPEARSGKVRCTKGMTAGSAGYLLPQDRKVIVGKSPQKANLVIVNNNRISNVHCTIRYNAKVDVYTVRDHSMNGTYVNGVRLQKEIPMAYPAGTVLSLADGSVEITLG